MTLGNKHCFLLEGSKQTFTSLRPYSHLGGMTLKFLRYWFISFLPRFGWVACFICSSDLWMTLDRDWQNFACTKTKIIHTWSWISPKNMEVYEPVYVSKHLSDRWREYDNVGQTLDDLPGMVTLWWHNTFPPCGRLTQKSDWLRPYFTWQNCPMAWLVNESCRMKIEMPLTPNFHVSPMLVQ